MSDKKKRVLWLINHTTLRKFEVPLLIELGYEVYLPKLFPYNEANLSASVEYLYDKTLTISKEDIDILNKVDFYNYIPEEAVNIINQYFDICIFAFFPQQIMEIVRKFKGFLILRPFGLSGDTTYTSILMSTYGVKFFTEFDQVKNRFLFGQAYDNTSEVEASVFKLRAITLPLGIDNAFVKDIWEGKKKRILFVCPRIETSPYYNQVYKSFINDFGKFDYIIGGAQPIIPKDLNVSGFLSEQDYQDMYINSRLMFYHSTEKRHIHYHPFEAIKCGLPLIFMGGGMLDYLGGKELPGRCENILEAKNKIKKIMTGDKKLINQIRQTQGILLEKVSSQYCKKIWMDGFLKIENQSQYIISQNKRKKIGIIIGQEYTGGVLDYALRLIMALKKGLHENKENVDLVFGHKKHPNYEGKDYFDKFEENNISVRPFEWKKLSNEQTREIIFLKYGQAFDCESYVESEYYILDDSISYFSDCDYLIFVVDRPAGNYLALQPYSVCVHDFIQRYLPKMFGGYYEKDIIEFSRNADAIIANTSANYTDAIQYLGVAKTKMKMIPLPIEAIKFENNNKKFENLKKPYFLWSTNTSLHKNHKVVLEGLSEYYQKGGNLKCYITGFFTDLFDVKCKDNTFEYVVEIRNIISKNNFLKKNLKFLGNLPKEHYYNLLSNAKFFLHGGMIDNGNYGVIDAAFLGVPSISSLYHAMEYHNNKMNLNIRFFNPSKPKELSNLLLETEKDFDEFKKSVPAFNELKKHTIDYTYKDIYEVFKDIIQF